jgi:hypothetical protein
MNIQELRKADDARGWSEIPEHTPAQFVTAICEKRAVSIATKKPIPTPTFATRIQRRLRHWTGCLEDKLRGRKPADADLRARLDAQHLEILKDFRDGGVLWQAQLDRTPEGQRAIAERQAREIATEQEKLMLQEGSGQWMYVGKARE